MGFHTVPHRATEKATQHLPVFAGTTFVVQSGANIDDPLSFADDMLLDDVYALEKHAERGQLGVVPSADGSHFLITDDSDVGTPGNPLYIDCLLTLMSPDGSTSEALVLVEVEDGGVAETYLLPFSHLQAEREYTLVGLDKDTARRRLAEVACVAFTQGTHITLASGAQCQIENLKVGDRVLTRDDGPQEVRWIGQNIVRAHGDFAPIMIRKGALNNENDLVVSPDHRLFVYQRDDTLGAGRAEVLVKARHLVNGESVLRLSGGFVEYYQLMFDQHQIIYAEGIAAESLMIDTRTHAALPAEMADRLAELLPGHTDRHHLDYEVGEQLLGDPDAIEKLRRASRG